MDGTPRRRLHVGDVCETDCGCRVRLTEYRYGTYYPWIGRSLADSTSHLYRRDDLTLVERDGRRPLTVREQQIVVCRCMHGLTNDGTGAALNITGQTVKNHVTNILRVLGSGSMAQVCFRFGKQLAKIEAGKTDDARGTET